ncbi:hypothetical protein ACLI09_07640 [Flavobacterium sp. RHBU_24]|uniref:hypothetical protein n=1 Tax=Flavobacterium sp. RHBU_24 TaxID=3391185 RepID=UPI0039848038
MFSWFKKKQQPAPKIDLSNLPALNEWGVFFQGNGMVLSSRQAGTLADGTPYLFLKSYPEVFELERRHFGDWLYPASNGLYLQLWENTVPTSACLMFIDFETQQASIIKQGITNIRWSSGYFNGRPAIYFKGNGEDEVLAV